MVFSRVLALISEKWLHLIRPSVSQFFTESFADRSVLYVTVRAARLDVIPGLYEMQVNRQKILDKSVTTAL